MIERHLEAVWPRLTGPIRRDDRCAAPDPSKPAIVEREMPSLPL